MPSAGSSGATDAWGLGGLELLQRWCGGRGRDRGWGSRAELRRRVVQLLAGHGPLQLFKQPRCVGRGVPQGPVDRVEVGAQRVGQQLPVGHPHRQDPRPALVLLQPMGRFHFPHHHLAAHRCGRQQQQQHIRLPQFPVDPLSPGGAYRHGLINKHGMGVSQPLMQLQGEGFIRADATLVADEDPHGAQRWLSPRWPGLLWGLQPGSSRKRMWCVTLET